MLQGGGVDERNRVALAIVLSRTYNFLPFRLCFSRLIISKHQRAALKNYVLFVQKWQTN